MGIIPSGTPPWSRSASVDDFGGRLDARHFGNQDAVNDQTDISMAHILRLSSLMVAISRMTAFATVNLTSQFAATVQGPPTINFYRCMASASLPVGAFVSEGVFTLTWEDSYRDSYGVEHDIDLKFAFAHVTDEQITSGGTMQSAVLSDSTGNGKNNQVTVTMTNLSNVPNDDNAIFVLVG